MTVQRLQILMNKKKNAAKHQKVEISKLLAEKKSEKAMIKVEHIIRDDFVLEGYELIELYCELLHERIHQITTSKECPEEMEVVVASLIWAAGVVDIAELAEVKKQLTKKFGKEFAQAAEQNNPEGTVNKRMYHKLKYQAPQKSLCFKYLEEIARSYDVAWTVTDSGTYFCLIPMIYGKKSAVL